MELDEAQHQEHQEIGSHEQVDGHEDAAAREAVGHEAVDGHYHHKGQCLKRGNAALELGTATHGENQPLANGFDQVVSGEEEKEVEGKEQRQARFTRFYLSDQGENPM